MVPVFTEPQVQWRSQTNPQMTGNLFGDCCCFFFFNLIHFIFDCAGSSLLPGLSSSCNEWGLLCSFSACTSHCSGFSCRGARALGLAGSADVVPGLSCLGARGILDSSPEIKPVSPALAGEFLTTGPPGKSLCLGTAGVGFQLPLQPTGSMTVHEWSWMTEQHSGTTVSKILLMFPLDNSNRPPPRGFSAM